MLQTGPEEDAIMVFEFGSWDGEPVLFNRGFAWAVKDGAWSLVNSAAPSMEARVLSPEAFAAKFPDAPPLPEPWQSFPPSM